MTVSTDLVEAHQPWLTLDLQDYLEVIGEMFSEAELYSLDIVDDNGQVTYEGWTILFDPDRAPAQALPYLAQYVGERLPEGLEEALQREWIKDAPNQRRGTLMSIVRAAQRWLVGQRTVQIRERAGEDGVSDDPERLVVITYTAETPDPDVVYRDLRHNIVAHDVELAYQVLDGQTWGDVRATHATWADVQAAYPTWQDMRAEHPGYTTWTRPRP